MAEIILDQPQVVPFVGKREATRMAEHVGIDRAEVGQRSCLLDNVVHRLPCERLPALGNEQPGKCILAMCELAADSSQLVASDWLFDAETVLETIDSDPRLREIDILPPHGDGLGNPKTVAEHHQKQEVIANAVTALFRGCEEPFDLCLSKIIATAFVGICGAVSITRYSLPVGHVFGLPLQPNQTWTGLRSALATLNIMHPS